MKKSLTKAVVASSVAATGLVARASESADTGVTEMNAGWGTFALLLGGVLAMGLAILILLKVMNRKR
jgi:hypothetical protein